MSYCFERLLANPGKIPGFGQMREEADAVREPTLLVIGGSSAIERHLHVVQGVSSEPCAGC